MIGYALNQIVWRYIIKKISPGGNINALEYVHLVRAGAFFRGVPDDVDDNVVVHFLQEIS